MTKADVVAATAAAVALLASNEAVCVASAAKNATASTAAAAAAYIALMNTASNTNVAYSIRKQTAYTISNAKQAQAAGAMAPAVLSATNAYQTYQNTSTDPVVLQAATLASALDTSDAITAQAVAASALVAAMTIAANGTQVQQIATALEVQMASHAAALASAMASHAASCAIHTAAVATAAAIAAASAPDAAAAALATAAASYVTAQVALVAADLTAANALLLADQTAFNVLSPICSAAFKTANLAANHTDTCSALNAAYLGWGSPYTLASWACLDPCAGVQGVVCNNMGQVILINITGMLWAAAPGSRQVPVSFATLPALQTLVMVNAQLTGTLPPSYSHLVSLVALNLSSNKLNGTLPPIISTLTQIQTLDISLNTFYGSLPQQYSTLLALTRFYVSNNSLTGSLPQQWISLVRLQQSGTSGLIVTNNIGLCGPVNTFINISIVNTSLTQDCPRPPSPPNPPPSPPLLHLNRATLQVVLQVNASKPMVTIADKERFAQGIASQYAASQGVDLSEVSASNILVEANPAHRQMLEIFTPTKSLTVSAKVFITFHPSVTLSSRMTNLLGNSLTHFDDEFLRDFGITSGVATISQTPPSSAPYPSPTHSPLLAETISGQL